MRQGGRRVAAVVDKARWVDGGSARRGARGRRRWQSVVDEAAAERHLGEWQHMVDDGTGC
ncbi:hypothetical protein E2562_032633 [Oryza meyeriana var. granulata]|uniref:Uncharacterized protein n=1 Tax=Oryza meyeriana var. granulata TaxID=110450 RepID=A0A6G1D9Z8_9ORYZ|nr:hypothetical protein E2562_032633 [Oryza meyeriana var. granulata]